MSDIFKIVLTSSFTIVGGVIIYIFGQIFSKFFIDPMAEQRKTIGEIADALIYYANIYSNPSSNNSERRNTAHLKLRELATLLRSKTHLIPKYKFFEKWGLVIKVESIREASNNLIGLSNSVVMLSTGSENYELSKNIKVHLKISLD